MRKSKKALAKASVALLLSSSMAMNALASTVTTNGTVGVETTAGNNETIDVTITIDKTTNSDGSVSVATSSNATGYVTGSGAVVDYSSNSDSTTGNSKSEYTSTVETEENIYTAAGGTELTVGTNPNGPNAGEVDVPLTSGGSNTVMGDGEVGDSVIKPEGDTDKTDGEYDYTTETVVGQGSVTVTTGSVTVTETVVPGSSNMEHVESAAIPDGSNDIGRLGGDLAPESYLPGYVGEKEALEFVDGYEYVYIGTGNTSQYIPAIVYTEPMSAAQKLECYGTGAYININETYRDNYINWLSTSVRESILLDENGKYVTDSNGFILGKDRKPILKEEKTAKGPNGETLYLHRFDAYGKDHNVEGWFEDKDGDGHGEWIVDLNGTKKYATVWAGPQQYVMVDRNGNAITVYGADTLVNTLRDNGEWGYNAEKLENSEYYTEEQANHIRAIALNGYWGNENGTGSLAAMKEMMSKAKDAAGNRIFTDEEINESLNDGVALSATQMAIWNFSSKTPGFQVVNSHYNTTPNTRFTKGDVPEGKEDEVELLFKLYDYLINLTSSTDTTEDTKIDSADFLKDMSVSVIEKAKDHENNQDDDDTNDAYVTNIKFALVVDTSTENGDELVVKVIAADGTILASGRVAGQVKDGETQLEQDADGSYSFKNITIVEGNQNFNITIEGIQNLDKGVYVYSSDVRSGAYPETPWVSKTMVGLAEEKHSVNVSMNISFDLNVDDEIIATEHVWRDEETTTKPPKNDQQQNNQTQEGTDGFESIDDNATPLASTPFFEIEEEKVPLSNAAVLGAFEMDDNMIPLAALPKTGDNSLLWMFMSLLSGLSLAGASLADKMKKRKR